MLYNHQHEGTSFCYVSSFYFVDIVLNIPLIFKSFCTFAIGWRNSTQRHIEFKKRYANRSVRNLGNSRRTNDDCMVVLTYMRGLLSLHLFVRLS